MQSENTPSGVICPTCHHATWRRLYHRQGWDFVRCDTCSLVRLNPIPTDEQLADHYGARFASGNYEPAKAAERLPTLRGVFAEFAAQGPGRLFDVGCFDGGLLDIASEARWETWGIDYQGSAVDIARDKHPGHIAVGPLETYEPPRRDFDVVTAVGLIEHLRQPDALARFAKNALRPGGMLVVQTPDRGSLPAQLLGRYWPPIAPPEHIWYFNRANLTRLLTEAGFEGIRVRSHWKRLRIGYAYEQLGVFGPELQRLMRPVQKMPRVLDWHLPMYGGEMLLVAVRSGR
jgi:2-polyprenyl-3-methyl-5-hydroxy-6-metoxy-1,4-benzoquinol methylase